jgi:hypothetical protein
MPYIAPQHRQELDALIDELAGRLIQEADKMNYDAAFAGLLNYTCTCLALKIVQRRFGRLRYWLVPSLPGPLKISLMNFTAVLEFLTKTSRSS